VAVVALSFLSMYYSRHLATTVRTVLLLFSLFSFIRGDIFVLKLCIAVFSHADTVFPLIFECCVVASTVRPHVNSRVVIHVSLSPLSRIFVNKHFCS